MKTFIPAAAISLALMLGPAFAADPSAGTTTGPAAGVPDNPGGEPTKKVEQPLAPGQVPAGQSTAGQGESQPQGQKQQDVQQARAHIPTTHELKESLKASGFNDVRILAESFVVQATKDGQTVTMFMGPNQFQAFTVLDPNGLGDQNDATGSVGPDAGSTDQSQQ